MNSAVPMPPGLSRIRQDIQSMSAYAVQESTGLLKLDAMENPHRLPPELQADLGRRLGALELNRYPGARIHELRRGLAVYQHALTRGALLRPLGSVVYFLPPYVITPEQIDFLAEVASEGIDLATRSAVSVSVSADLYPNHRDPG